MNDVQIFNHDEFGKIRGVMIDGNPWFVGKDVAQALGYTNPAKALIDHVDEEDKLNNETLSSLGQRGGWLINESGLYSLILSSKLPDAKKFKRWVTSEVLPSIRKTGSYSLPGVQTAVAVQNSVTMNLIVASALKDIEVSTEIAEKLYGAKRGIALAASQTAVAKNHNVDLSAYTPLLPPAEHEIGYLTPTQIGKNFGISARVVNKILVEKNLQVKEGNTYILTDEGKNYGEAMPFNNNGHSGYQIKWSAAVFSFFEGNGYTLK